jgi:hypothetical protein
MSIEPIGIVLVVAGLFTVVAGLRVGAYLLCISTMLGAAAALLLPALGGSSIQPAHFMLVFLVVAVLLRPQTLAASISCLGYPGPGFWFALFTFYCVLTAFFLPRIFGGATIVYSLARVDDMRGIISAQLAPGTSNLTQSCYMLSSLAYFAIFAGYSRLGGTALLARALTLTGAVCIFFAVADVVTYQTNTADLLSVIRNANYRMLNDGQIEGFKRIVGSFPEAGAFGYAALALFTFALVLWLESFPVPFLTPIGIALGIALLLSTSTTAYVSSAFTALMVLVFSVMRILGRKATSRHLVYAAGCLLALPLLIMMLMLIPSVWDSIQSLVHVTLTTKLQSQSGTERMRWNVQAITSFIDTNGMGAGLGSIRASSFVVALLANVGVPGAVLFLIFLVSLVRSAIRQKHSRGIEDAVGLAGLLSCLAQVTAASISASAVDLGPLFSITSGLAAAYALGPLQRPVSVTSQPLQFFDLQSGSLTLLANSSQSVPFNRGDRLV